MIKCLFSFHLCQLFLPKEHEKVWKSKRRIRRHSWPFSFSSSFLIYLFKSFISVSGLARMSWSDFETELISYVMNSKPVTFDMVAICKRIAAYKFEGEEKSKLFLAGVWSLVLFSLSFSFSSYNCHSPQAGFTLSGDRFV